MIVVDASAAIRWFKSADAASPAYGLPRTDEALVSPDLFVAEVRSAALAYLRKRELTVDQAKDMIRTIDTIMSGYFPIGDFRDGAWSMALEFDHSPYDCFYIELARSLDTRLITADERLVRKFAGSRLAGHIVPLSEWHPQE